MSWRKVLPCSKTIVQTHQGTIPQKIRGTFDTFASFNFKIPSSKKTLILVASGLIPHFSFLIRVHIFPLIFHFPLFKLQRENGSFTAACLSARKTFMSVEAHKILNWIFASKHISILDMCCTTAVCWDYAKPIFISLQKFPSKRNIKNLS